MTQFDPQDLRRAFGRFMTGVTVVTTRDANGNPVGFTANSFTSVSIHPPLLLVCPGSFLSSYAAFTACDHFAISVLAEGQEEVSNTFASFKGDRFARVPHKMDLHDIPVIDGAAAQFSCKTHQCLAAGDHSILIGEVRALAYSGSQGLGYAGGRYFSLGLERAALNTGQDATLCGAIIENNGQVLLEHTPEGHRPPQCSQSDRANLRLGLTANLQNREVLADIGTAYSIFDDAQTGARYVYFLASGTPPASGNLGWHPISTLTDLSYTTPAIGVMMRRYALEAQTGSFSLYLGDEQQGDVHAFVERT